MSLFFCTECPGVHFCILTTEPQPCTVPHSCTWGESLVQPKFYELTKELAKKLRNIANQ